MSPIFPATARVVGAVLTLLFSFLFPTMRHDIARAQQWRLTPWEVRVVHGASNLAAQSPSRALSWIKHLGHGIAASMGPDGTLQITLPDGRNVAVLRPGLTRVPLRRLSVDDHVAVLRPQFTAGTDRAIVLEPFANELLLGPAAGKAETDALTSAGFSVDVKRNGEVSIPVMESLGAYSVVYMETHSGTLPGGDAIVVTGDTNIQPYASLAPVASGGDGSLMQALVAGDPTHTLYIAITAAFVNRHMMPFPTNSLIFLNGCSLLSAPIFWQALTNQHVGAMISWDQEVGVTVAESAADVVMNHLTTGRSVTDSIKAAYAAGLGEAPAIPPAHLGFLGDGNFTLSTASPRITPTSSPTPTSIAPTHMPSPTQTPTPARLPTSHYRFKLTGVRFERSALKGKVATHRLTSARRGTTVQLSAYYTATGVPTGCHYSNTLVLFLGSRRIHQWTLHSRCRTATWHDSISGVTLVKPGTYTLSARLVLNSGAQYSARTRLNVL